ncbi:MAG: hypothetical protein GVY12_05445 [Bacteroidetes bacterium]|jgi:hypothetical protein|nr:hypothetical protein [Bacteroidota bacterium]
MRQALSTLYLFSITALLLLLLPGCEFDITNPNNPSEEQVLTTTEGIEALTVGMQEYYATTALQANVLNTGTTSREVAVTTTFANLINLEAGGEALPNSNANVLQSWSRNYRVVGMAEEIILNAPELPFEEATRSGIVATAHLFKAMALGNIAQTFEQGVLTVDRTGDATFVPRVELFEEAIRLLEDALDLLQATPPSDAFRSRLLAPGVDLENTLQAYRARYHLFAGNYGQALSAADAVDAAATSTFPYDDLSQNPVYVQVVQSEALAPRNNFGSLLTEVGDERIAFYTRPPVGTTDNDLEVVAIEGFFASPTTAIPLYVPGEMDLIRAEALVRSGGSVDDIVAAIDAVRTKTSADDPFGLGAGLEAYAGDVTEAALLEEIWRQRRAELFLQGLGLEDSRRLGPSMPDPADPFARNRNFYPYPQQERDNNPNVPDDPTM